MTDYYADSSVLVKRHVQETGAAWFRRLADPATGNVILTARISAIEVYSALSRRRREARLSGTDYDDIAADFAAVFVEYQIIELTALVTELARSLLERHPLRAYDATQLASALMAQNTLQAAGLPPLTFLAADDRLLAAAQAEELLTDNPNLRA
jgi:predicted nucleic acid-binding protein